MFIVGICKKTSVTLFKQYVILLVINECSDLILKKSLMGKNMGSKMLLVSCSMISNNNDVNKKYNLT